MATKTTAFIAATTTEDTTMATETTAFTTSNSDGGYTDSDKDNTTNVDKTTATKTTR